MNKIELAEISEEAAEGEVRVVYDAIRADMGVAVVNLIWRRLAVQPEALRYAWQRLQPIYASGATIRAALDTVVRSITFGAASLMRFAPASSAIVE